MTATPSEQELRGVDEQASAWLLTLQTEELTSKERAAFVDWLRASPLHIARMLRICQLQRDLSNFRGWDELSRHPDGPSAVIMHFPTAAAPSPGRAPRRQLRVAGLIAAGIAALSMVALMMIGRQGDPEFRTQIGERREITLSDGSVLELAPHSDLVVRYRERERLIVLNAGEALFRVTKDVHRPFVVQAESTRVRAVGTVFDVESGARGISVTVVEGRVAVSQQPVSGLREPSSDQAPPVLSLGARQQVSVSRDGVVSNVRNIIGATKPGNAPNQIVFENETIGEVARQFNLRNQLQVEVQDPALLRRRVSGIFDADEPQSFVAFIAATAGAQVTQADPLHVIVGADATPRH